MPTLVVILILILVVILIPILVIRIPIRRQRNLLRNMDNQEAPVTDPVAITRLRELAAALSGGGIDTLEDLRLSICKDFETGIKTVTDHTKTSQALLVALLITE